jgi:hypothetical protein
MVVCMMALVLWWAAPAQALPGWGYGNHMWFRPGTTNINGTLYAYKNGAVYVTMTAGSGMPGQGECVPNAGRIPNGWDSTGNDHHIHNKNGTEIDGRVWGLQNKKCSNGTLRTELFIHTEETVNNGQDCPTSGDDKHCWETAEWDYRSIGCVKISHPAAGFPDSVGSLNGWWDNQVGGGHNTPYPNILWVGSTKPPAPPT